MKEAPTWIFLVEGNLFLILTILLNETLDPPYNLFSMFPMVVSWLAFGAWFSRISKKHE